MNDENKTYTGKHLWDDPMKEDTQGVLLSDRIAYYADVCTLVTPFNPEDLRPASYTLHVGDFYWVGREKHEIGPDKPMIIPANGLVYVQILEYFNIPYYMIARYSLRVTQVYRGLVLDNGLQIDPGYHGHIHVPIYNLTNDKKVFLHRFGRKKSLRGERL